MAALSVGDKAPAFTLKDQDGKTVRLSQFKGKNVVVYFYPKADTPGCTTQSCNLRDAFPQLKKLKAVVLGISPDPVAKQKKFDDKYGLGFPLLSDEDHKVAEAWGVWGEKSLYGRKFMGIVRSAFVVDDKGKLKGVFYKVSPKATTREGRPVLSEELRSVRLEVALSNDGLQRLVLYDEGGGAGSARPSRRRRRRRFAC